MPYCKNKKIIFLGIPKTASTSIIQALGLIEIKYEGWDGMHLPYQFIQKSGVLSDYEITSFKKFTFVRNPWGRAYSDYLGSQKKNRPGRFKSFDDYVNKIYNFLKGKSINIELYYKLKGTHLDSQFLPQIINIIDEQGNVKADFIGKFEELRLDMTRFFSYAGITPIEMKVKNKSGANEGYKEIYEKNPELYEMIKEVYKKDIDFFGYGK